MSKDATSKIFVDHYLQAIILTRLSSFDRAMRFSELKEDGVDNSLFMYHANKLIARKAIIKNDEGFHLTAAGARWINSTGLDMKYIQSTAKPLIQFVVRDKNNNLLLSTRKGQLKKLLNDYMLPGGLHKSGMSADDNAKRIARSIFGDNSLSPEFLSIVESINTYSDGFIYHSLSHVYTLRREMTDHISDDDRFAFEWVPIEEIRTGNPLFAKSIFLPQFIEKLQNKQLATREVIQVEYT